MNYAPSDLVIRSSQFGFIVTRTYTAVDTEEPFQVLKDERGKWHIKKGLLVRVTITMVWTFSPD